MVHQIFCLVLLTGVVCLAFPTENFRPQRQLFSPDFPYVPAVAPARFVVPQAHVQDPYFYPVAGAYVAPPLRQYAPPQVQYGVLPPSVPSSVRYAPALVATNGHQQVIFTPPGPHNYLPSNVVVYRPNTKEEGGNSEEGYLQSFLSFVNHYVWPQPQPAEEGPSGAEQPAESEKPEKVQASNSVDSNVDKEDKKDEKKVVKKTEKQEEKKNDAVVVDTPAPQRFVVVGEPQFFGRFSGVPQTIRQPPVAALNKGAVSSYLLFRNFGAAAGDPQQEIEYPQAEADYEFNQDAPGRAALNYQKLLAQAGQREAEDTASVVVEAASKDAKEPTDSDTEKVEADEDLGKRRQH